MPFENVSKETIIKQLQKIGVKKGATIYVASFMPILGNSQTILEDTVAALLESIGKSGTVVMPAFNWDYCTSRIFDPATAPSQVGVLTEEFRKHPDTLRSLTPPWCTFTAAGKKAKEIVQIAGTSSFGSDSIIQYLYDVNAKYVLLGCLYNDAVVHVHWLEEKFEVPYRYWKQFIGKIKLHGELMHNVSYMYARRLDVNTDIDSHHLTEKFEKTGKVRVGKIGLGQLRCFNTQDYVDFMTPYFEKDKLAVLVSEARKNFE